MEYLSKHNFIDTNRVKEAQLMTSRIWHPHRSEPISWNSAFHSRVNFARLRHVALSYVDATGAIRITTPASQYGPYTIMLPLCGTTTIGRRRWQIVAAPGGAYPLPDEGGYELITSEHTQALVVHVSRSALQDRLAALLCRPVRHSIAFHPSFPSSQSVFQRLRSLIGCMCEEINRTQPQDPPSLGVQQLEEALLTMILLDVPHRYSSDLQTGSSAAPPWYVRRVEDYIVANLGVPLSVPTFASLAGVTSRTLQEGFRRHRGCSPIEFVRAQRLQAVRRDLEKASPETTITGAATQWGFNHLGRFSQRYAAEYGENPSVTLSRSLRNAAVRRPAGRVLPASLQCRAVR